jgi:predicted ribosome quality control (RQC) complex YloA/Tae2 family protein
MKTFLSTDGIKIHVGENAKDNDRLTESSYPEEWWLHVAGAPGSHVVVAFEGDVLPKETKRDAAVLAAHYSKAPTSAKMTVVDLCRVKDVGMGKAHGQVYLDGEILQLHIFMRREKERLERLLKK